MSFCLVDLHFILGNFCLVNGNIGFGIIQISLKNAWIYFKQQISGFDKLIIINRKIDNWSGYSRSYLDDLCSNLSVQIRICARSKGSSGRNGVSGKKSSRYSLMKIDSIRIRPS